MVKVGQHDIQHIRHIGVVEKIDVFLGVSFLVLSMVLSLLKSNLETSQVILVAIAGIVSVWAGVTKSKRISYLINLLLSLAFILGCSTLLLQSLFLD